MPAWLRHLRGATLAGAVFALVPVALYAQPQATTSSAPPASQGSSPSIDDLLAEIRRLETRIELLQTELADSKRQAADVQQSLQQLRDQLAEERELLDGQIGTLDQSKVESGSRYRVRLFGMALMQLVSTRGAVDNIDLPALAMESRAGDSGGNISAAVRQSFVGLAVFGPRLGGAETSADLRVDFFGGFPAANDGLSAPGLRLRTMTLAAEGRRVSIRAGQDTPFFSPLSPTSLASTAYPALSSSGNIWAWTPQVYVERRTVRANDATVLVQGGVLDALTGELPAGEYSRLPTSGERSRTPAVAGRAAWRRGADATVASVGGGVYYSRQNWTFDRTVDAWAATGDVQIPVSRRVALSGEIYRGRAIGGLGGGTHSSVLFEGAPDDPASVVHPLRSTGGWAQLKIRQTPRLEFNLAGGMDRSLPAPFDGLLQPPSDEVPSASRNASGFANFIYQVRSNILLSVEYRRLWTRRFDGRAWLADHVSVSGGFVF